MSTLDSPAVAGLLKGLFAEADRADPAAMARAQAALSQLKEAPSARQRAELMRNVYMPISPDVGCLLYILARTRPAKVIVEFGTSFGISGIHLARRCATPAAGGLSPLSLTP
jgi:predicted O-methyltransferase YrrM